MKLNEGKRVAYSSRMNAGTGKITRLYDGGRGSWVTIFDRTRGVTVTVRPSQVRPA